MRKSVKHFMKMLLWLPISLLLLPGCSQIAVLNPAGPVARSEMKLIIWSFVLMAFVVLVVLVLYVYILIKYRARPGNEDYEPEQDGNKTLEIIWTVIPIIIVILLAIPTVKTIYSLVQPPEQSQANPVTINVTSVNWKWIFQYPDEKVETVNYVVIPTNRPVEFRLSAVGPMNSFWVPELGGQEFSMPGHELKLWLQADKVGDFLGRSANFSGQGFTHMTFHVLSKNQSDYDKWVQEVKQTAPPLTKDKYKELMEPGLVPKMTFSSYDLP